MEIVLFPYKHGWPVDYRKKHYYFEIARQLSAINEKILLDSKKKISETRKYVSRWTQRPYYLPWVFLKRGIENNSISSNKNFNSSLLKLWQQVWGKMEFNVLEMRFFMIKRKVLYRKVLHNFYQIIMDLWTVFVHFK